MRYQRQGKKVKASDSSGKVVIANVLGQGVIFLLCSVLFLAGFSQKAGATDNKVNVFMNTPEWNGKQLCDGGTGALVSAINAPSISISLEPNTEVPDNFYFDFVWEKKVNDGMWQSLKGENNATLVPAMDPGVVVNDDPQGGFLRLSWRLRVRSAGGSEWFTSEEYRVSIVSRISATHVVSSANNQSSINITVRGGMPSKTFQWTSLSKGVNMPKDQRSVEDPIGLTSGIYQVLIKDECQEKKYTIEITENKNK